MIENSSTVAQWYSHYAMPDFLIVKLSFMLLIPVVDPRSEEWVPGPLGNLLGSQHRPWSIPPRGLERVSC